MPKTTKTPADNAAEPVATPAERAHGVIDAIVDPLTSALKLSLIHI